MREVPHVLNERFELTVDDHVAAIRQIAVARTAQLDAGSLGRIDRGVETVERWGWRAAAVGFPLLLGIPLLLLPGMRTIGIMTVAAAPVLLLVVLAFERLGAAASRRFDTLGDGLIDRSTARGVRTALDRGTMRVLLGSVTVRLDGTELEARSAEHLVVIPDVRVAWRDAGPERMLLAPGQPLRRESLQDIVLLPVGGVIATAISADHPAIDV